jgi:phosphoribosyl 1,2-cyclic phosphodiesterase
VAKQKADKANNASNQLTVCTLASGSKGNAIYLSDGSTSILIDAGLSGIQIERRLESRGLDPQDLQAIIVSHEHSDHTRGVGVLARRYHLPVYINPQTLLATGTQLGRLPEMIPFECGTTFKLNQLAIRPFSISHDARDPAGFTVKSNGIKIGCATDLGIATGVVRTHLKGCRLLIVEANHDPIMLEEGPYPWPLKQRIKSRLGHLSNNDSQTLIAELQHAELQYVILAHLSETNNLPDKAYDELQPGLCDCKAKLTVALQDEASDLFCLG